MYTHTNTFMWICKHKFHMLPKDKSLVLEKISFMISNNVPQLSSTPQGMSSCGHCSTQIGIYFNFCLNSCLDQRAWKLMVSP